jgi:hypothetical protein
MEQLLVHLLGDFIGQSDYMALNKSKKTIPCLVHVLIYTSCFLLLTTSWKALVFIGVTHFILDRWHTPLRRLIWSKGHLNPTFSYPPFEYCNTTGYYDDSPYNTGTPTQTDIEKFGKPRHFFLTMWLYIIHDNFIHLVCNYLALAYLR